MTTPSPQLVPPIQNACWDTWSPASLPEFEAKITAAPAPETGEALFLKVDRPASYARWVTRIPGLQPGETYEFSVRQHTEGTPPETEHVPLILSWYDAENATTAIQRDYVDGIESLPQGWVRRFRKIKAPERAVSVEIQLGLRWAAGASVFWSQPQLVKAAPQTPRIVRVATTRIFPPYEGVSVADNTRKMADMMDRVGPEKPDIVLFSECLVNRHVQEPMAQTAQTIPGPLTDMLSEKARRYGTYIVTSLHEVNKDGHYSNTAVLIDRQGAIAGKYSKVHLTMTEAEAGLLPGNDYPVFDTDFGRVGMLVCWDNWFPESVRALRLQGAEMIFLPIAGDGVPHHWEAISKARALDNSIYLVSSATETDNPSCIINPAGEIVGEATGTFGHVVKEVDLSQTWRLRWLSVGSAEGEAASLYREERRPETYHGLLKG